MKRFAILCIGLFSVLMLVYPVNSDFTIVIDPGHGGRDPGAVRGVYKEKEINLGIATELGRMIERNMPDVNVVYTRKSDVFVALEKRSEIANKAKANLFISVHTNSTAAKTTSASGADTYILGLARSAENLAVAKRENSVIKYEEDYTAKYEGFDPDSPESYIIFEFMTNQYMQQSLDVATYIQQDFRGVAKRVDRGVRQAGFLVLRESSMPSILIELGFINNPTEAKYLSSADGQRKMASAIYSGFKKYKEEYNRREGGSVPARSGNTRPATQTNNTPQSQPAPKVVTAPAFNSVKSGQIEYRVQFLYSPTKLSDNSPRFQGLQNVSYYQDGGYKYTAGSTTDYNEILRLQREVRKKFKDAFVIKMRDGKRL